MYNNPEGFWCVGVITMVCHVTACWRWPQQDSQQVALQWPTPSSVHGECVAMAAVTYAAAQKDDGRLLWSVSGGKP
jgi:hypothetical protein